ncbi:hypothetical protein N658DRAFT_510287 [Parathielavia hyrcaniae]|uniref:Uncharacterized protein n=1 Tax=Parathielavia hyrcaniae TaxID=113614 RepID=A0AAN6PVV3_9PEZI|nr:hypothetical protein N658DRAFT_510287 [Parathielavia hyrcaniae]
MTHNGAPSHGAQYLPYRPTMQQDEAQQQQQQQQNQPPPAKIGQHAVAAHHEGFQPYKPQQEQQQQFQAQHPARPTHHHQPMSPPPDAGQKSPGGMTPAPLRLGRKPVSSPTMSHGTPPLAQAQAQAQQGYFPTPTPSPSPYAAGTGNHQPQAPAQHHGSHHHPQVFGYNPGIQTPPATQPLHATQGQMAQGQPTPPAFHDAGWSPAFLSELPGSVPYDGSNQTWKALAAQPLQPAKASQPSSQVAELGSGADPRDDLPSQQVTVQPAEAPRANASTTPAPTPAPTAADSEGLIPVEKPAPPDHEGLIPFHPADTNVPASTTGLRGGPTPTVNFSISAGHRHRHTSTPLARASDVATSIPGLEQSEFATTALTCIHDK